MDIQHMVKTGRRQEWADMVMRCCNSGLTVVQWCKQEGLSPATYQYRRKQVMDALEEQALPKQNLFVPLTVDTECTVSACADGFCPPIADRKCPSSADRIVHSIA